MPPIVPSVSGLANKTILGHPVGLYILFFTEMWERFSYYGMRALLMTYMVTYFRWSQDEASSIYKWYTSLVYVTPIIGGFLADRYLGNRAAVFIGAILMAIGHFLMAFEASSIFFAALVFLIVGNGFFKPNMTTQVGRLYPPNDRRRDGAYTIFYMGINLGAFMAPIACGWLQENTKGGFHAGFAIAGVGMILGLITYMVGQPFLVEYKEDPQKPQLSTGVLTEEEAERQPSLMGSFYDWVPTLLWMGAATLLAFGTYFAFMGGIKKAAPALISGISLCAVAWINGSVKNAIRDRVTTIIVIGLFAIFFWAAFEQQGNALNLWADKVTNRNLTLDPVAPSLYPEAAEIFSDADSFAPGQSPGIWDSIKATVGRFGEIFQLKEAKAGGGGSVINPVPTAWFQSINALGIFLLAPIFAYLWLKVDLSIPAKMVLGLTAMGASFFVMVFGATAENQKHSVLVQGPIPTSVKINAQGHIMVGDDPAHAARLRVLDGKIECFGVFSDLERDALSSLSTPQGFKDQVSGAATELDQQKMAGKPRFYVMNLPESVAGFEIRYGGFHPQGVQFDKLANTLTIKQTLPEKDQKALLVCAANPLFRSTLDNLMVASSKSRVSSQWLLWCYILATMGELCLSPVGLSMTSKLSPRRYATMLMGLWLLVSAFGNFAAGAMGEIYEHTPPTYYFGYMTAVLFGVGLILWANVGRLTKMMHGVR